MANNRFLIANGLRLQLFNTRAIVRSSLKLPPAGIANHVRPLLLVLNRAEQNGSYLLQNRWRVFFAWSKPTIRQGSASRLSRAKTTGANEVNLGASFASGRADGGLLEPPGRNETRQRRIALGSWCQASLRAAGCDADVR